MNTYPIFAALFAALGGALFAEWRQAPSEPAVGFLHLSPLLEDAAGKPITSREAWSRRREELRRQWEAFLGPFPPRVPLEPEVLSTEEFPDHTRLLIRYHNEAEVTNDAYLLLPKDGRTKHPAMVVLHQTTDNTIR